MRCPKCNGASTSWVSRTTDKETYRLYCCKKCHHVFGTREVIDSTVANNKDLYFKRV